MSTSLYKHYDAQNRLLYVGISKSHLLRLHNHSRKAVWISQIARIDIKQFGSREDALRAEKVAIKKERPIYNVVHNEEPLSTKLRERLVLSKLTEADVVQYPLVVAERDRIPRLFKARWSLKWIADHFGTTPQIIKFVLESQHVYIEPSRL